MQEKLQGFNDMTNWSTQLDLQWTPTQSVMPRPCSARSLSFTIWLRQLRELSILLPSPTRAQLFHSSQAYDACGHPNTNTSLPSEMSVIGSRPWHYSFPLGLNTDQYIGFLHSASRPGKPTGCALQSVLRFAPEQSSPQIRCVVYLTKSDNQTHGNLSRM